MRFLKWLILIALLIQGAVYAESPARSTEITIYSGWSFLNAKQTYDVCPYCLDFWPMIFPPIETQVQQSMLFGFKAGYYINRNFEVEGGFAVAPNHNVKTTYPPIVCIPELPCPYEPTRIPYPYPYPYFTTPGNLIAYQYEGNFVYNFTSNDVRPFVTFGIGGVASDFQNSVRNNFAFNFGGGAKFYFNKAGIRFEVNDHVLPSYFFNDKTQHDLQIQYGFVFRIP